MKYAILLSTAAEKEIEESFNWYEDRLGGLGARFMAYIERSIGHIAANPEAYPNKKGKYREIPVEKFPYLIIYEVRKQQKIVYILHIFNTHRNPRLKYKK
ncbi:type II toxin-antitoxin system RelE/ParE family toxin [Chitinophaga japonensis]|uniref:ParE-like toxin of type II ParDE toxin-antitoxin system n=1 Tax=Chitinophaga japonensis TaxID=104662 RepID=A0A562T5D4_CHIJA|nr:type II toxin-antitoxin system RelE/ParE family toxin [Chitinophaga japonensis]TWI88712.1 ParE-like toxin of type II ParDE toxin-antitoxin system [Chitinophaga japonensis]